LDRLLPTDLSALAPLAPELAATIARVASDIALVIDDRGVIRMVAEGSTPLSPACSAWVGQAWIDTVSADTRPKIELLLREVNETGFARRREVNHPVADSNDVPVAWSAIRLGRAGAVVAVGRDLRAVAAIQQRFLDTQRELERAYWQRRQAQTRHRLLYQVAHDAVYVLDATTLQVIDTNEAGLSMVGLTLPALAGRGIADVVPTPSRAAVTELLTSARTSGRAGEIRVRLTEHEPAADLSATPFRAGDSMRLLLRARRDEPGEDALVAMAGEVDGTTEGVVIVDAASRILMANAAFLQRVNLGDEAQAKGRPLADVVGDVSQAWAAVLARVRTQGVVARERLDIASTHRERESVEVTATLLADGEQEAFGLTIAARPGRRSRPSEPTEQLLASLQDIAAQVGRVPLATLLREAEHAAEKHLILTAVQGAGGRIPMAAQLLGLRLESLTLRMRQLGMPAVTVAVDDVPPSIN
jgi:transcriptional regulator PpsR